MVVIIIVGSLQDWPVATIVHCALPEQPASSLGSRRATTHKQEMDCVPTVRFDESFGRLVVCGDEYEKYHVLDLALPKPCSSLP